MVVIDKKSLKVIRELVDAIADEADMDACSTRLGKAVSAAEDLIDKATRFDRENAFGDQSKW